MFCKFSNAICWCTAGVLLSGCGARLPQDRAPDLAAALKIRADFESGSTPTSGNGGQTSSQQPTGFANLRGVFRLRGTAPPRSVLNVSKDVGVCAPGGKQVFSQALLVDDATQGIANVVVFATSVADDWVHESAKPGKTDEVEFDQKGCVFLSHVLAIQATQKLKILNSDPVGHNTNLSPQNSLPFNQTIASGSFAMYQPEGEERQPFSAVCSIHPWMQAWIITRRNSYFAVTKPDGSFEIPNLPTGVDLEFRVWQEKVSFLQDVIVKSQPAKWPKGKFVMKLDPNDDSQNQLEVEVDAAVFE